jgi:hypothetical protein
MPTSDQQEVHLGGGNYAGWDGRCVVLVAEQSHTSASITLEPEELGRFMDWLHDLIQSNPEGAVFTRRDAP